ncbi:MAG: fasciclin domain-containing protein [Salinisphaera sp.]|nr:fasciclin domain-containing protein [Salinisphaera sp.]
MSRKLVVQVVSGLCLAATAVFCTQAVAADSQMGSMGSDNTMSMSHSDSMPPTMVGGHAMLPSKNIVQNAVNSNDHTTLVAAVKQAGLVEALEGPGPYTVFAPTNAAFNALPKGTVGTLMKPANKDKLKSILLYHVVKGRWTYKKMVGQMLKSNSGQLKLTTLNGNQLTAKFNGDRNIVIVDDKGDVAHISTYDVFQSNGVIQVVDHVLLP